MKTIKASGELTKNLSVVQAELDEILEELSEVLRQLEREKKSIIEGVIAQVSPNIPPEDREYDEAIVEANLEEIIQGITQARSWIGRLNNIARNGLDIAKKVEKTWFESLRDFVQDSRWYRDRFPEEYQKKQTEREYDQYKLRPETFYGKPSQQDIERMKEFFKTNPRAKSDLIKDIAQIEVGMKKRAQVQILGPLTEAVEKVIKRIFDLVIKYFSDDSPILAASDKIIGKVKSERGRKVIDPTLYEALGDKIQALEALFGSGGHPGRFITSGSRAFLVPAIKQLQQSVQTLYSPTEEAAVPSQVQKDLKEHQRQTKEEEERKQREKKPQLEFVGQPKVDPGPSLDEYMYGGGYVETRLQVLMERRNITANRKRRCHIVQRIASSKEEFFNG